MAYFIKYNNAVPIVLGILFLGTSGALAASPEVRADVFSSSHQVVKVDNTRIVSADIDAYPLSVQITAVREDTDNYYVDYILTTIDLVDGVWKDTAQTKNLSVSKAALGDKDLGTYVSTQLAEVRDAERQRLRDTQVIEQKRGASAKVVATTYSGLVGKFLSPSEEKFAGYVPVVAPQDEGDDAGSDPNRLATPVTSPTFNGSVTTGVGTQQTGSTPPSGGSQSGPDTTPPQINVLGDNPARVAVGQSYTDFGVAVVDDRSSVTTLEKYLDGARVSTISINTSSAGSHSITYKAFDQAGNSSQATRSVVVYVPTSSAPAPDTSTVDPAPAPSTDTTPPPAPSSDTTTTTSPAPSTDTATPSSDTTSAPTSDTSSAPSGTTSTSSGTSDSGSTATAPAPAS